MKSRRRRSQPGESSSAFPPTNFPGSLIPNRCRLVSSPLHIAAIPGSVSKIAQLQEFDVAAANFDPPAPKNADEILTTLEAGVKAAEEYLGGVSESNALGNWRLSSRDKEVFPVPRVAMLRSIMLNHWYHHRGQLSVYLRLLDVPVPVIYGRSADENPFG
jgi:uncharacterized damage-inducible protein DinB